jgi:hypothetical protein
MVIGGDNDQQAKQQAQKILGSIVKLLGLLSVTLRFIPIGEDPPTTTQSRIRHMAD